MVNEKRVTELGFLNLVAWWGLFYVACYSSIV